MNRIRKSRAAVKRTLPLAGVYRLLEPGPVVLLTTARKGRFNIMPMSWHTILPGKQLHCPRARNDPIANE